VFPDPDRFDIDRDNSALTIFGHGPHYCIGVHLARSEMRATIDAALDLLPAGARHRTDLIEWQRLGMFRRPLNCPVDFGA
jgi:cytochrome P450